MNYVSFFAQTRILQIIAVVESALFESGEDGTYAYVVSVKFVKKQ